MRLNGAAIKIGKPRPASQVAALSGCDEKWRTADEIAARVTGYARATIGNNLTYLSQEGIVATRYGAGGRYEFRLAEKKL